MVRSRFISDSERNPLIRAIFPRQTSSGTIASLKSLHSTWCSLHRSEGSRESSSFMADFMPLTLQPSTSACRSLNGLSSGVRSRVSKSTLRWTSLRRYLYSTESPMPMSMMLTLWTGSHTNRRPAMYLIEATLTSLDFIESMLAVPSLSFVSRGIHLTKLSPEKTFLKEQTTCVETKPLSSRESRIQRSIQGRSDVLFTMLLTWIARLHTTQTTSNLQLKTSLFFIDTDGKSNCFLNGLSSISGSSLSGEKAIMRCAFRYMLPSSHTVSSESSSTTSNLDDLSCRSCESLGAVCLPKMTSWSSSPSPRRGRNHPMMGNLRLALNTININ